MRCLQPHSELLQAPAAGPGPVFQPVRVYLDAGLEGAVSVIRTAYSERLHELAEFADLRDPKSRLQEYLQGRRMALPEYAVQNVSGKAHQQTFEVICNVPELDVKTYGTGSARRDAEQQAADAMLNKIEGIHG